MQTTLLGLGIAIILALVAALVGPFVIDWGSHRTLVESEVSHFLGAKVRVAGAIDARLLPSPRLVLHDVTIGPESSEAIHAQSVGVEFGLGPLMRGEWHATEMDVAGLQLHLGLDRSGHVQAPAVAVKFDPDIFSIDRLSVHDGRVVLSDAANGQTLALDKVWFNGDARSLLGPVKGEGAFKIGDDLYPYRLAVGRLGDDGKLKLQLSVNPVSYPLSIEGDGTLSLAQGKPQFDGTLNVARPVAIAAQQAGSVSAPWRLGGKVKVTASGALMQDAEFQYGSEPQAINLTGTADFRFGAHPHFDGVLSAHQIDLDHLLGDTNAKLPPAAAFRKLALLAAGAFRPRFPISIGLGIDQVTLGGRLVQTVRGDVSTSGNGWNLDRFEFRAPGLSQVRLSGRLEVNSDGVSFTGPAEIDSADPRRFAAWLTGEAEAGKAKAGPLNLRGEMTLGHKKIAIERLAAKFDRETISGRLVYQFAAAGQPSQLDASLNAPQLDLDAALGFSKALIAGSSIERPHNMAIAVDIGHATLGGIDAQDLNARVHVNADGLDIERLAIGDLGGATFSASGRIETADTPHGRINVDLAARDLAGATGVLAKFAPTMAAKLAAVMPAMAPAKLHATLNVVPSGKNADGKLDVEGTIGAVHVVLAGNGVADVAKFDIGNVHVAGKLNAKDGRALIALLDLGRVVNVGSGSGSLTFDARGPARGDLRVSSKLLATGLEATASGTARVSAEGIDTAALKVSIVRADAAPLRAAIGAGMRELPIALDGRITLSGSQVKLSDFRGSVAGTRIHGDIAAVLDSPVRLSGDIGTDHIDATAIIAAAIGVPHADTATAWHWASEPFASGIFSSLAGAITLKATRADLTSALAMRQFRSTLKFDTDEISVDDVSGDVAGGHLKGQISFRNSDGVLATHLTMAIDGADVAALMPESARPPLSGKLALKLQLDGNGMSPSALIGSLRGSGSLALADARIAGADPHAFEAVANAVDQGMAVEPEKISEVVDRVLESGHFAVASIGGNVTAAAGQLRLGDTSAHGDDADLSVNGALDLTDGTLDARLVLTGASKSETSTRPDIFMAVRGPIASPSRSVDVSALTGWLTLRAVERQAKRLEAAERARAAAAAAEAQKAAAETAVEPAAQRPTSAGQETPTPRAIQSPPPVRRMPTVAEKKPPVHPQPPKRRAAPALPPPLVIRPAPNPARGFSTIAPN